MIIMHTLIFSSHSVNITHFQLHSSSQRRGKITEFCLFEINSVYATNAVKKSSPPSCYIFHFNSNKKNPSTITTQQHNLTQAADGLALQREKQYLIFFPNQITFSILGCVGLTYFYYPPSTSFTLANKQSPKTMESEVST